MRIKYCFFIGLLLHYAAINAAQFIYVSRNNVTLFADGTVESTEFYRITKNGEKTVVTNATPVKATTDRSKYLLLGVEENLNGVKNSFFGREIINGINGFSDNLTSLLAKYKLNGKYVSTTEFNYPNKKCQKKVCCFNYSIKGILAIAHCH